MSCVEGRIRVVSCFLFLYLDGLFCCVVFGLVVSILILYVVACCVMSCSMRFLFYGLWCACVVWFMWLCVCLLVFNYLSVVLFCVCVFCSS